ncbi:hypothetical protein [Flavisolibacter ginsenosidimutans]|uniref:Uncharacterized protein n=1 Tax=Flavisolibacter ginsenosidimutans TaxID=661481 RepID=A0A5B8UM22_9BACT|nr:hypothetical protein [Flavisolibacter ginsenosidimutans]QEC57603.1 hypothetical protein FSB75_17390 [Flavisolibacter ginsenosidimutans]
MRRYFLIFSFTVFGCASNQQPVRQSEEASGNNRCLVYPKAIDSLQVKDLYDSAQWYIYTWSCNQSYLPKSRSSKSVTFGELPLKFKDLSLKHDTLQLNFDFVDESEAYPILPSMTRDNKELVTSVGFDMKARKRIYMGSPNGFTIVEKGIATRYENPLQPEVLSYIKGNWNKLNDCFKRLGELKGIRQ